MNFAKFKNTFFERTLPVAASSPSKSLSINQLKTAFVSLKIHNSTDTDKMNYNAIKNCFVDLCDPLKYLFNSLLQNEIFSGLMKLIKVSLVFKARGKEEFGVFNLNIFFRVSSTKTREP